LTYQMMEAFLTAVTIPIATAFSSGVCPHVLPHQPKISELTLYVPMAKMIVATQHPVVPIFAQANAKPKIATALEMVL
jgi:hypothetical protein